MLILLITGAFLDAMIGIQIQKAFDTALLAKARALETLLEQAPDGIEFEFADEIMPEFKDDHGPQYFQIWLDNNAVFERSHSLNNADLPRFQTLVQQHSFHDIALPDGRPGRLVETVFVPRVDIEEQAEGTKNDRVISGDTGEVHVTLVLARERVTLQQQRFATRLIISGAMLMMLFGILVLVRKLVSIGLLPLERLATQVKSIDERTLDRRVTHEGTQSVELAPIEEQVNGLLGRLESAFQRENRFSADVAHELRTPLAELRSLAEVGALQPEDREAVLAFFGDVKDISVQMEKMVGVLLELARADAGQLQICAEDIHLAPVVNSVWTDSVSGQTAHTRFRNEVAEDLLVRTDREKLEMILRNLLTNAVIYSQPGTPIRIFATQARDIVVLGIENHVIDLDATDIPMMRERFWRKDQARSNSDHTGLGLALVEALAGVLTLKVELSLDEHEVFRVVLRGLRAN